MSSGSASIGERDPASLVRDAVEHAAHLLPAQGPISVFIHHNTLHAFEDQPFEEAVVHGGRRLGCEPWLAEHRYRKKLRRGRIAPRDLDAVLDADLDPSRAAELVVRDVTRRKLRRLILVHGIPDAHELPALQWLLSETDALTRLRADLPSDARASLLARANHPGKEAQFVGDLWRAALDAAARAPAAARPDPRMPSRHRDLLHAVANIDTDEWIHPILIRFTSAYLDQGLADWPMAARSEGMHACFLQLYGQRLARLCAPFGRDLVRCVADDREHQRDGWSSLLHSLAALGIAAEQWKPFLVDEALALRGWAGMVRQFEQRPDRVPAFSIPARLVDYLAVRLLLGRAALSHAACQAGIDGPLSELAATLRARLADQPDRDVTERAWPIFHAAQLCGLDAVAIDSLSASEVARLEAELADFGPLVRRRLLHLAYERHLRHRLFDALSHYRGPPQSSAPAFQAIFCLDEREESFRRHLEEAEPEVETFGLAGFFGIAMYFRGATDAHPRALCPVAIEPQHYVAEAAGGRDGTWARWRRLWHRFGALVDKNIHVGSRQFGRGAVIMATLGVLWIIPLVLRVLLPWSRRGFAQLSAGLSPATHSRLHLDRLAKAPPLGRYLGFTVDEMAEIVHAQLAPLGILERLAPLVFVFGHGSTSLNNPQESAHDCGACGGGRGGPNARAFAQMANDSRVRAKLAGQGIHIRPDTWFVGGQRNTANNDVIFFDEDLAPAGSFSRAKAAFEVARRREAHERCRRFESAPRWLSPAAALLHVQARAADLAQPRPEYGHATNAFCMVGRRATTRGLFLDRRAFLVSYDPAHDPDGAVLSRLLAAVVPVVAGISLEYFFGYVDPTGYGCGTKLPHNVTALVGVMDGAQSDLRTGLPWQMLEIHEPVRLTIVVETPPQVLLNILEHSAALRRLVDNRWLFLAALDPVTNELHEVDAFGLERYVPEQPLEVVVGLSQSHYRRRRGHLPLARIATPSAQDSFS